MVFDIHCSLTNKHGWIDEAVAEEFEAGLMERFADSPEAKPILERTGDVGWAGLVLRYGRIYEGVAVTTMGKQELSRVLLDVFPRKVSCEPSSVPKIIEELRAFWSFVRHEFELQNAGECLAALDDEMTRAMERELSNPRNFGIAKSFVMAGTAAGFDMTTQEGIDAFMRVYNANLLATGVELAPATARLLPPTQAEKNKKKAQRKAQRASRRKSR